MLEYLLTLGKPSSDTMTTNTGMLLPIHHEIKPSLERGSTVNLFNVPLPPSRRPTRKQLFIFKYCQESCYVTARTFYSPLNVFVSLSNCNYSSTKILIGKSQQ